MKIYAIADLHGRYDLLLAAVARVNDMRAGEPAMFLCLGDFVDRGPQSAQIIKYFRQWNWPGLELKVLQGNHEAMMVEVLPDGDLPWWFGNGGIATLKSYGYSDGDYMQPYRGKLGADLAWLASLPLHHETEALVFVHAGVLPDVAMAKQPRAIVQWHCWDKNWTWDDEHSEAHNEADYHKHVVHGHEQWAKGAVQLESRTNLDSFAWSTGNLAIGVFDPAVGQPEKIVTVHVDS